MDFTVSEVHINVRGHMNRVQGEKIWTYRSTETESIFSTLKMAALKSVFLTLGRIIGPCSALKRATGANFAGENLFFSFFANLKYLHGILDA